MKSKFDFFEIVTINTQNPTLSHLNEQRGVVLAKGQEDEESELPVKSYVVCLYQSDRSICFDEAELLSTDEFDKSENFHAGKHIRVGVDPHTGEGKLTP